MQAVSVKVGKLYGVEYVNQLYKQLLTFHKDCIYYCMTDDPEGLDKDIQIIKITDSFKERKWWNKIKLFEPGLFDQPTIYLDLDCYIHTSLDKFFETFKPDKLNILKTNWFSDGIAKKIHQCNVNSSIMVINDHNCEPMWKEYQDHIDRMYKSFYGLDPWLYRRHMSSMQFFQPGLAYSFKHGSMFPNDIDKNKLRQLPVCIFDDAQNRKEVLDGLWQSSEAMG